MLCEAINWIRNMMHVRMYSMCAEAVNFSGVLSIFIKNFFIKSSGNMKRDENFFWGNSSGIYEWFFWDKFLWEKYAKNNFMGKVWLKFIEILILYKIFQAKQNI